MPPQYFDVFHYNLMKKHQNTEGAFYFKIINKISMLCQYPNILHFQNLFFVTFRRCINHSLPQFA
jgi:hypothetical protein